MRIIPFTILPRTSCLPGLSLNSQTILNGPKGTQIRYKNKVLPSHPLQFWDFTSISVLKKHIEENLEEGGIKWSNLFLYYKNASTKRRDTWISLNRENFQMIRDPGKLYVTDSSDTPPADVSAYDLYTDHYYAALINEVGGKFVGSSEDFKANYENLGFSDERRRESHMMLHQLMRYGAVVIFDEVQAAPQVLEMSIAVKEQNECQVRTNPLRTSSAYIFDSVYKFDAPSNKMNLLFSTF